jgi:hypothetical protein
MMNIWPELPIYIYDFDYPSKEARNNVVAALKLNHRVSGIYLEKTSESAWEAFAPLMQHPFPILTHLWVQPYLYLPVENTISRSFLGGSAPSLRDLVLIGVPFSALPELLLSTTNLVRLWYDNIPRSGYILPQAMVTGLSALTRLESLSLTFSSPHSFQGRPIPIPHPHTRTLLPALTYLRFRGDVDYVEDLVAQIDTPLLEEMVITLFGQEVLDVSQLAKFVRRADKLSFLDRAEVAFSSSCISVTFLQELLVGRFDPNTLMLYLGCHESDLRLSYIAQFCSSCLPTLSPFKSLHIHVSLYETWEDFIVTDAQDSQWLEFLRPFNVVKNLHLSKHVASRVAQVLRGISAGRVTELLPALEAIFISDPEHFGPVMEAISDFADARQLSGHPLSIYDWQGVVHYVGKQGNGLSGP